MLTHSVVFLQARALGVTLAHLQNLYFSLSEIFSVSDGLGKNNLFNLRKLIKKKKNLLSKVSVGKGDFGFIHMQIKVSYIAKKTFYFKSINQY